MRNEIRCESTSFDYFTVLTRDPLSLNLYPTRTSSSSSFYNLPPPSSSSSSTLASTQHNLQLPTLSQTSIKMLPPTDDTAMTSTIITLVAMMFADRAVPNITPNTLSPISIHWHCHCCAKFEIYEISRTNPCPKCRHPRCGLCKKSRTKGTWFRAGAG